MSEILRLPAGVGSFAAGVPINAPSSVDVVELTKAAVSKALSLETEEEEAMEGLEDDVFGFLNKTTPASSSTLKRSAPLPEDGLEDQPAKKAKTAQGKGNAASHQRRKNRRLRQSRVARPDVVDKFVKNAPPIATSLDSESLPTTATAYTAKPDRSSKSSRDIFYGFESTAKAPTAEALNSFAAACSSAPTSSNPKGEGFKGSKPDASSTEFSKSNASLQNIPDQRVRGVLEGLMQDDGFAYKAWQGTISHPILDSLKRVAAVLVAKPNNPDYDNAARNTFKTMDRLGASASFSQCETDHLRGRFPAVNVGISLGPGGTKPTRVQVGGHEEMMQKLLDNKNVQRLASLQDASLKLWAPRLHAHYESLVDRLLVGRSGRRSPLHKNFSSSVFTSMAFNFPPSVRTIKHRDIHNLPYGLCAIHALGDFDHTAGGHLILWELKLIIEFPPGAMVLIPSAIVTHSNVPTAAGQIRASITQYTGGSLFRFVDNGFCTDAELKRRDEGKFAAHCAARQTRWEDGLKLWSKFDGGLLS